MVCVGASADNDIVIDGAGIPQIAAKIECAGSEYVFETIQPGPVRINGKKLKTARLVPGDKIEIGNAVFIFEVAAASGETPGRTGGNRGEFFATFSRFAGIAGTERDLKTLLRKIIEALFTVIGGTEAFIFVLDKNRTPVLFVASSESQDPDKRFSDTIVQEVLGTGSGVSIPNALSDPKFSTARSIADLKLESVLCCPIVVAGCTIGVIYVGSRKSSVSFTDNDLETLKIYALLAGMLINHVEFIAQQHDVLAKMTDLSGAEGVIAQCTPMKKVIEDVDSIAPSDIAVLLQGETGTGKDVMAQLIHRKSVRAGKPFVAVNCSSLHGPLLESELFGHKRGAFTGAVRDHDGLFMAASGGTIFLDEIGEMDVSLQPKLLRTLETGMIRPVGSSAETAVDARIICATNADLNQRVADGRFRQDLFYRLNQFAISLPPLRERGEDIELLAHFFLEKFRLEYPAKEVKGFLPESLKSAVFYDWPGNVRELANMVHKAVLSARGPLVSLEFRVTDGPVMNLEEATNQFQKKIISRALALSKGNKEKTAELLGMSRSTFFRYLANLGIQ